MFLCSRWGKTFSELQQMGGREFFSHLHFWKKYPWGISDDLLTTQVRMQMPSVSGYDVKLGSVQDGADKTRSEPENANSIFSTMLVGLGISP